MKNRITEVFGIKYPIISGGMVWCSGWKLASAVSNAGGLGLIGSGSMHPDTLREHIQKCKAHTSKPYGVNVPMFYPELETIMAIIIEEKVPVVFTSAGSPKLWTKKLQSHGIKVAHVVASSKFALKCEEAGVDAIVAEGFEAGGHNGKEETTTMTLIPQVAKVLKTPFIAAGGIATGGGMLAALALGAEGVQLGTRFALTQESSASEAFKQRCIETNEGDTMLTLKQVSPTRLVKNEFYDRVLTLENKGADIEELRELQGKGRAKKGIFEGDLQEGMLEIGQIASLIREIPKVENLMEQIIQEFNTKAKNLSSLSF